MAERTCSVKGCEKKAHARSLCPMHYQRWRLHGSTDIPPPARWAPFRHGTSQGYRYHACRCEQCKQWRRDYTATYTARRAAAKTYKHGIDGYNCGCRCEVCTTTARNNMASWYQRNTAQAIEGASRNAEIRRARQKNLAAYKVTARDWRRLCQRFDNRCAYCRKRRPLQREHVVPISRGGQHSIGNLLPSCKSCNLTKGTKLLVELKYLKGES
jgi:5-methylcytosine-specific restriction endonuclease McrA